MVTRGYSNSHRGYTSDVAESGDRSPYAFAEQLQHAEPHVNRRVMKERKPAAATQALAADYARRELSRGSSIAEGNDAPSRFGRSSAVPNGYTSAVPESREGGDADAYAFAASISHDETSRADMKGRVMQLAEEPAPAAHAEPRTSAVREDAARDDTKAWAFAGDMEEAAAGRAVDHLRAARGRGGPASLAMAHRRGAPLTTAIPESRATAEQHAWAWAAAEFHAARHPEAAPAAATHAAAKVQQKFAAPAAPKIEKAAAAPVHADAVRPAVLQPKAASAVAVAGSTAGRAHSLPGEYEERERQARRQLRSRKISAARKAVLDLHAATMQLDHEAFERKQERQRRRTARVEAKEREEQRAADRGAREEDEQYAAIASLGVPSGRGASFVTDEAGLGAARRRRGAVDPTKLASQEESAYSKGFQAGLKAEEKSAVAQRELARTARTVAAARLKAKRDAGAKKVAAKKAREEKEAREQSLADNTWDDADSDFQVDGGNWGPGSGDWA